MEEGSKTSLDRLRPEGWPEYKHSNTYDLGCKKDAPRDRIRLRDESGPVPKKRQSIGKHKGPAKIPIIDIDSKGAQTSPRDPRQPPGAGPPASGAPAAERPSD